MSKVNLHTSRVSWSKTKEIVAALTPEDFERAARQEERREGIADPGMKDLLKYISRVGSSAPGI